ncbi:hypothetical protein QTI03_09940 [Clostridium perfringens]|nr:hypothetical protein [Clostridium perfringens]
MIFIAITLVGTLSIFSNAEGQALISPYIRFILMIPIILYIYININTFILIDKLIKYSFIINMISIFQILKNKDDFGRIASVFSHPNFYAFYLIIIILVLNYFLKEKKINFFIGITYMLINIVLLMSAGSKTAFFAVIIIIFLEFIRKILKVNKFLKVPFIFISILIVCFIIFILKDKFYDLRIFNINYGLEENQINSFAWRVLNWKSKFECFDVNILSLLFGLGWGSEILFGFKGFAMHNEYLRIFFETGILGSISIIIFIYFLYKNIVLIKDKELKNFFINLIIVIIVGSLTENIFVAVETTVLYLSLIFSLGCKKI